MKGEGSHTKNASSCLLVCVILLFYSYFDILYLEVRSVCSILENSIVAKKLLPFFMPLFLCQSKFLVYSLKLIFKILRSLGQC
jgi:hypothetical protein